MNFHIRKNGSVGFCGAKNSGSCGCEPISSRDKRVVDFLEKRKTPCNNSDEVNRYIADNNVPIFYTSRTERQYMGYAIEDYEKSHFYHDIMGNTYTGLFDAMDSNGVYVQIKAKKETFGHSIDDVSYIELGEVSRLAKKPQGSFILDVVLYDGTLVYERNTFHVSTAVWLHEIPDEFLELCDPKKVFDNITSSHDDDGRWKDRTREFFGRYDAINRRFSHRYNHDLIFVPHLKRDSRGQKRIQVSIGIHGLIDISGCAERSSLILQVKKEQD